MELFVFHNVENETGCVTLDPYFGQLLVPGRALSESGSELGRGGHPRGSHPGHTGAVRALLRDGLHVPAVQDLRGERQGRAD